MHSLTICDKVTSGNNLIKITPKSDGEELEEEEEEE
jgi:hypothetical protein